VNQEGHAIAATGTEGGFARPRQVEKLGMEPNTWPRRSPTQGSSFAGARVVFRAVGAYFYSPWAIAHVLTTSVDLTF